MYFGRLADSMNFRDEAMLGRRGHKKISVQMTVFAQLFRNGQ